MFSNINLEELSNSIIYPDKDSIKMFVGQLPKNIDEVELKNMFEQFGKVYELKVLKNAKTGESKGCCFVKFYTREAALNAQLNLNNKLISNSNNPIQMKPADLNRKNRKLFVGMISHYLDEKSLCDIFEKFGAIDDCKILRDFNGRSKCCAFITFSSKYSASNAIKFMHHNFTMKNCSNPINVKYADTFQTKLQNKLKNDLESSKLSALLSFQQLIDNINSPNSKLQENKHLNLDSLFQMNDSNNCKYLFGSNYDLILNSINLLDENDSFQDLL